MAEQQAETHVSEHASFIKTPKQLAVVLLLAHIVPIAVIAMLAKLVTSFSPHDAKHPAMADEAVAQRIKPVGQVVLGDPNAPPPVAGATAAPAAPAPGPSAAVAKSGEEVYKQVCQVCHAAGVLNAPKPGDNAAWAKLIPQGLDALTASAIKGVKAMPPRGGNPSLSDLEVRRAVVHMANQSGANWKEPEAVATK